MSLTVYPISLLLQEVFFIFYFFFSTKPSIHSLTLVIQQFTQGTKYFLKQYNQLYINTYNNYIANYFLNSNILFLKKYFILHYHLFHNYSITSQDFPNISFFFTNSHRKNYNFIIIYSFMLLA